MKLKARIIHFMLLLLSGLFSFSAVIDDSLFYKYSQINNYSEKINFLKKNSEDFKYKDWNKSLSFYQLAIEEAQKAKDTIALAEISVEAAYILYELGRYEEALQKAYAGYDFYTYLNNPKGIAKSLNEIGTLYDILNDKENALKSLQQSLEIRLELNDAEDLWESYLNLGVFYYYSNDFDKALEYYKKAQEIKSNERVLVNIGEIYMERGNLDLALDYFNQTISMVKQNSPDGYIEALATMNIGIVFYKKNNLGLALDFLYKSLEIANKVNTKLLLRDIYSAIVEVYVANKDFKSAFETFKLLSITKDELFNEKQIEDIARMKTIFETEQKENQIKIQEYIIKQSQSRLLLVLLTAVVLIIAIVFLVFSLKLKQKTKKLLEIKNQQLELSNATKDKFFSIISHDLRSPVASFRNLSGIIGKNVENYSGDQIKDLMQTLNTSAEETFTMLNNLLEWSKSQQKKIQIVKFPKNIKSLCTRVINELSIKTKEKDIIINSENIESFDANVDENVIATAIRNVLTNAIKFSPNGSQILIEARQNGRGFFISIQDYGIGMSETDLQKLFRIEHDTKTIGKSPEKGSGLGLILCKELVSLHGGDITVESEINKGSRFKIIIPQSEYDREN